MVSHRSRIACHLLTALVGLVVAASVLAPGAALAQTIDTTAPPPVALVDHATKIALPGKLPGVTSAPWDLTVTANAVWVLEPREGMVFRVAPATNRVVARVKLPAAGCVPGTCPGIDRIVGDSRDVWVINNKAGSLVHVDARKNKVVGTVPITTPTYLSPVADAGGVWLAPDPAFGDIAFVDAKTNAVTRTAHVGVAPAWPVALVGETLWASSAAQSGPGAPPDEELYRIDHRTAEVAATMPGPSGGGVALGTDFWVNRQCCPSVTQVDGTTGAPLADVLVDGGSVFLAAGSGSVWVRLYNQDMSRQWILRVDPSGASTEQFDLPTTERTGGLGVGFGSLWVTNWNENAIYRMPVADR